VANVPRERAAEEAGVTVLWQEETTCQSPSQKSLSQYPNSALAFKFWLVRTDYCGGEDIGQSGKHGWKESEE
jgi:hypothetical protein